MPFSPENRRLTILSIVTVVVLVFVTMMYYVGHSEAAKAGLLVFGPVAVIWNNERDSRKTRKDLSGSMRTAVQHANEAAVKADQAVTVTVESFEALKSELGLIKSSLNGELDQRIVATVDRALDAALDKRMDALADRIADRLTSPTPRVRT